MKTIIDDIKRLLQEAISPAANPSRFFKTKVGDYAEHEQFNGVPVPSLRKIAKIFESISLTDIQELLSSKINEERLLALLILVRQYQRGASRKQQEIYQFYLDNLQHINNWNLVDSSAHLIMGAHLWDKDREILVNFAKSDNLWERRIAIVTTWYFIRQKDLEWTFKLAIIMLKDNHDLLHKAVGWMLREAGKKDEAQLQKFLEEYSTIMPKTMLRYARERLN